VDYAGDWVGQSMRAAWARKGSGGRGKVEEEEGGEEKSSCG
jgi:hypothetical protein